YFLSGETHRLLEVRTYNREGKYLAWAGSSSTSVFQSEGKSTTQNFKGQPEAAELIIAGEIEEETFPFDFKFSRPSPPPNQGLWEVNVPTMTLAAYESQRLPKPLLKYCKQKKKPHAITGNVGLCLSDLEIKYRHFGKNQGDYVQTHISLDVPHPHPPALDWNLSGAKVVITKINFKNEKTGKTRSQPVQIEEFINLNSTGVNLDSEIMEMKDEKATGIEGYLQINLPAKLSKLTLDLSELGNQAENDAGLKVKLTGFSSDGAKFDVTGPREKVVQYQPRDRQGKALKQSFPSIRWSKKKESWWGKVAIPAHAKTLDIVYATRQEQKRYPFKIRK
ncbi:MAG: hypothetical protein GWM98_08810, partial [Nitrospinaceae bacterium]|nr:hypothetical protein [Nitrospinaceae bacterium]